MDFNFVSKNNIGAVSTLVLIIILSQSRFFDFLIDTALGRAVLILFILVFGSWLFPANLLFCFYF